MFKVVGWIPSFMCKVEKWKSTSKFSFFICDWNYQVWVWIFLDQKEHFGTKIIWLLWINWRYQNTHSYMWTFPIWCLPFRPPDKAAKIKICMNTDFSLVPKDKTCFSDHRRGLLYLHLQQEATIDLYCFPQQVSLYRVSSVNKNQIIFRHLTVCSGCTN